jgi:predicted nuclease with TOPRIM domain
MAYADDLCDQLAGRYEKRHTTFSKLFNATIVFALAFLTFILIPLVGLQLDEKSIAAQFETLKAEKEELTDKNNNLQIKEEESRSKLTELSASRANLDHRRESLITESESVKDKIKLAQIEHDQNATYLAVLKGQEEKTERLKMLMNNMPEPDVNRFVTEVRAFLGPASEVVYRNADIDNLGVGEKCPQGVKQDFFDCLVKAKVMLEITFPYIQGPLAVVPRMRVVDESMAGDLEKRINIAINEFDNILSEDPGWWQEVTRKRHIGQMFEEIVLDLMRGINSVIEKKSQHLSSLAQQRAKKQSELTAKEHELSLKLRDLQRLNQGTIAKINSIEGDISNAGNQYKMIEKEISEAKSKITEIDTKTDALNATLRNISTEKEEVTKRIENVESPFGALPVGLNEALQVFPVIVVVGVMMLCSILAELINLRRRYHLALRSKYAVNHSEVDDNIAFLTPIFVDPCRKIFPNLLRGIVFITPLIIYFVSIGLITYSWSLDGRVGNSAVSIRDGYLILYIILIALVALPLSRVVSEWLNYGKNIPTQEMS